MVHSSDRGRHLRRLEVITSLLCIAAASGVARAQSATDSDKLEQVLVTATRAGAQNVQNIPMAVSVVSTEELDRQGVASLSDLQSLLPSMAIQEVAPGQNKFAIRGIVDPGNIDPTNLEDQSLVSVYLDDTPISLQGATPDLRVYDLERVEVIRGPQGTLYGAGSMAGTIRFITRKPDAGGWSAGLESMGSTTTNGSGNYDVRGTLNAPIVDGTLAGTLTAYKGQDSGWIDNIGYGRRNANRVDTEQARGALRLHSGVLTIDASLIYSYLRTGGSNAAYSGLGNGYDEYTTLTPEYSNDRLVLSNLTAAADLDTVVLTSSTSYFDRSFTVGQSFQQAAAAFVFGYLTPSADVINNRLYDFTEELRVNSKGSGPFKWIAGVFYEASRRHYLQNDYTPGLDAFVGIPSTELSAPAADDLFYGDQHLRQRQLAVFGEGTYTFAGKLDLTAGARYFDYNQTYGLFFGGIAGSLAPGQPLTQVGRGTESGVNPRAVATYHLSADQIVFFEAARGFRYGGVNQPVPASFCGPALAEQGLTGAPLTFGPDKLWSYSLGEKSTFAGGKALVNATAFFIDWRDLQTNDQLNCGYYFTQNAGKVTSKGLELESTVRVDEHLTLGVNASYTDATAAQAIPNLSAVQGDRVPYFPPLIAGGSASYRLALAAAQSLVTELNAQYRGSTYSNFSPDSRVSIPSSTVFNASITYVRGTWELGLFGRNLTDAHIVTSADRNTFGAFQPGDTYWYARPRTVGIRARVSF